MDVSFGFKVCRVCLKSSQETLLSTVEANLENAEVFYKVGRIDVSSVYFVLTFKQTSEFRSLKIITNTMS